MRARLPLLFAAALAILLVPNASADGVDPCADHFVTADYVVTVEGSACHDGYAAACWSASKCVRWDWCTFCPGPVLW